MVWRQFLSLSEEIRKYPSILFFLKFPLKVWSGKITFPHVQYLFHERIFSSSDIEDANNGHIYCSCARQRFSNHCFFPIIKIPSNKDESEHGPCWSHSHDTCLCKLFILWKNACARLWFLFNKKTDWVNCEVSLIYIDRIFIWISYDFYTIFVLQETKSRKRCKRKPIVG